VLVSSLQFQLNGEKARKNKNQSNKKKKGKEK